MTADLLDHQETQTKRRSTHKPEAAADLPALTGEAPNMMALVGQLIGRAPTGDIEYLNSLVSFQERLMAKQAEIDFNEAKAKVISGLVGMRIVRTKSVRYEINKQRPALGQAEAFKYAPLEAIEEILAPLEAAEGLHRSYTTTPRQGEGGGLLIIMKLKHKNSHYELHEIPLPLDTSGGKNNLQAYGSTMSYGRRYLSCMGYNIPVYGDDDDGNGGFVDPDQLENLRRLIAVVERADAKRSEAALCTFLKLESLEELPHLRLRQAIGVLEEAAQKLGVSLDG